MGRTRRCRFAQGNLAQRFTLIIVGAFINNQLLAAVSIGNLARPLEEQDKTEPPQRRVIELPFFNQRADYGLTTTVG